MTKEEKLEIISNQGFTDYQSITIYDEMDCSTIDNEEAIIDAANDWWQEQLTLERCGL